MRLSLRKPDSWGALASTLCLIHCIATPLLFIAHAHTHHGHGHGAPLWWKSIDYIFLVVSFFAIYRTVHASSLPFIKPALWTSWVVLSLVILNEKWHWFPLPEAIIYIPTIALVALHIYNLNHCQCTTDKCCSPHE